MKYWSKLDPQLTAEVPFDETDPNGVVPAQVFGATWDGEVNGEPVPDPFYTMIKLDEWSPVPLASADFLPEEGFLVLDMEGNLVNIMDDEDGAKAVLQAIKGLGYVPVRIQKHAMIERKS